jgi:CspA family cold shock protein
MSRTIGRVKWYNNKTGFGFITYGDDEQDIFVHHTGITVNEQNKQSYRYLVQGEYVEFDKTAVQGKPQPYAATHVTGIKGGPLMYETRLTNRPNA